MIIKLHVLPLSFFFMFADSYRAKLNKNSQIANQNNIAAAAMDILMINVSASKNVALTSEEYISIFVHPVNDRPVLEIPGSQFDKTLLTGDRLSSAIVRTRPIYVDEDSSVDISLSFRDADIYVELDPVYSLSLTTVLGYVSFNQTGVLITDSNFSLSDEGAYISLQAPYSVLQSLLALLTFAPALNYHGFEASLTIRIDDMGNYGVGGSLYDQQTIYFIVQSVNDAPTIYSAFDLDGLVTLEEGKFTRISGSLYFPDETALNTSWAWSVGYELFRFDEPRTYSSTGSSPNYAHGQVGLISDYGPGQLEWKQRELADIRPGYASSHPKFLKVFKGVLYLQANDGFNGIELYSSASSHLEDITFNGESSDGLNSYSFPSLFFDLMPGAGSSNPSHMTVSGSGSEMYFAADGVDLSWMPIADHYDECNCFRQSAVDPSVFFAVSESNLWDPNRVYDCPAGYHWASTQEGRDHFTAMYENYRPHMWKSEAGAEQGVRHGKQDVWVYGSYEDATSVLLPGNGLPDAASGKTYYNRCGWNGYEWGNVRRVKFRFSDSNRRGSYKHAGRDDAFAVQMDSFETTGHLDTSEFAGIVCIVGEGRNADGGYLKTGKELWRTDGTSHGTTRIEDLNPGPAGSDPQYLTWFNGLLYYSAYTTLTGRELFRTTGNMTGSSLVSTTDVGINPGVADSDPADLTVADYLMFFAATTKMNGRELWTVRQQSKDHLNGLLSTVDIMPGSASSFPAGFCSSGGHLPVFFVATTSDIGEELWSSDGTVAGTALVIDIFTGPISSSPKYITWYEGKIYFQANDGVHGIELWSSDGTAAGTSMLMDIRIGVGSSSPAYFTIMPSSLSPGSSFLFFSASDGAYAVSNDEPIGYGGSQLWRTDGTAVGTRRAFHRTANDFYFDTNSLDSFGTHPCAFTVHDNALYIPGNNGLRDVSVPKGFDSSFRPIAGIDQAAVLADVDTPANGNVTLLVEASNGLVVMQAVSSPPHWSNARLHILVGESFEIQRNQLFQIFTSRGHIVDLAVCAEEVFNLVTNSTGLAKYPYDILLLEFELRPCPEGSIRDGINTARSIRFFESLYVQAPPPVPYYANRNYASNVAIPVNRVTIIGVGDINILVNGPEMAEKAGMDAFIPLPVMGSYSDSNAAVAWDDVTTGRRNTEQSAQQFGIKLDSERFHAFAVDVENFLYRRFFDLNVTDIGSVAFDPLNLPSAFKARSPAVVASNAILLEGTLAQVNAQLQYMYFYAAPGYGTLDTTISLTLTDRSAACHPLDELKLPRTVQQALYAFNSWATAFSNISLCDMNQAQTTVRTIALYIEKRNQPPSIFVDGGIGSVVHAAVDVYMTLPVISVADPDVDWSDKEQYLLNTSYGEIYSPPVSLVISLIGTGRVSLTRQEGIVFVHGKGDLSKQISLRGAIPDINNALLNMWYICQAQDGCISGAQDTLTIMVDDDGFIGLGGPLQAHAHIKVLVL